MSTLRNLLANNPRVKEILQMRKTLGEAFPYTDWTKVPVKHYSKFLSLKDLIGECGVVWTNAFKRSNTEAEDTRKYLKDYSGNERDMELFNFGYSKQSGFNGYVQDFRVWGSGLEATLLHQSENSITVKNNNTSAARYILSISSTIYTNNEWKVIVEADEDAGVILNYLDGTGASIESHLLHNGLNVINISEASFNSVVIAANAEKTVTLTQIAPYQGAIVGDGVDDYGQCIKDFVLPDDYTVCAIRKYSTDIIDSGPLISKGWKNGIFYLENKENGGLSYGKAFYDLTFPPLFSYQTKSSYNGEAITPGTASDNNFNKLVIFSEDVHYTYKKAALYSFGVFNRTLTAEELALVEDCMYLELEYNTTILDGIEYYDILDARYRSNEEAEDKRNKWNGRLGKLHMTLNNYGYSQMSGWNGMSGGFQQVLK